MFPNVKLSHKVFLLVGLPLAFQVVFVVILYLVLFQAEDDIKTATFAKNVNMHAANATRLLLSAGSKGLLYAQTLNPKFYDQYNQIAGRTRAEIEALEKLFQNDEQNLHAILHFKDTVNRGLMQVEECIRSADLGDKMQAFKHIGELKELTANLTEEMDQMTEGYRKIEERLPQMHADSRRRTRLVLLCGVIANIILFAWLAVYFTRDTTRRIQVLADNARRMGKGEDLLPGLTGTDEVAFVDGAFHKMAADLAEAARLRQQLIAVVAHELRTPLTSIGGFLSNLSQGAYCDLTKNGLSSALGAETSSKRLVGLINDLIDVERMEAGKFPMEIDYCDLQYVYERAVENVSTVAEEKNTSITFSPTDLEAWADVNRVIQVVVNLLGNAVKFSPEGSEIEIRTNEIDNVVEVQIVDQATVVPLEKREQIFGRFSQLDESVDTKKGGAGLGLAICKAIISQHDGTIGVRDNDGKGNVFWFRLARAADDEPDIDE